MFGTIGGIGILVPICGMIFAGWLFYLDNKEKRLKNKEKLTLIEKGIDPSLIDSKPKRQHSSLKTGLLFIGVALGVLGGYIINITFGIPNFVAYSTMILIICGVILISVHKSKTE